MVNDAHELFNLHAFGENCIDEEWNKLAKEVIDYAKELPLALKALGSFLRGNNKEEWKSQLEKLKKMPFKEINDVLRLSFDTLDRQQKDVFLYIACFFKGYKKCQIITFLDACGFSTTIELKVLRDKALITWTSETSIVSMHDLIEEMRREIVRESSKGNLGKCTHLWDLKDICEVLQNNKGTEYIQSISLIGISVNGDMFLKPQVFAKMNKLKFLKLSTFGPWQIKENHQSKSLEFMPNELRLLHWDRCPLESLPSTSWANNLVELHLTNSNLQELWDGVIIVRIIITHRQDTNLVLIEIYENSKTACFNSFSVFAFQLSQPLANLKKLDMSGSKYLIKLPNFSLAKNLKEVILKECENLCGVNPSIFSLPMLETLDLSFCRKLTTCLQHDKSSNSLCYLFLRGCTRLKKIFVTLDNMIKFDLSYTRIKSLPSSFRCLGLECLNLDECKYLTHLPNKIVDLKSLWQLSIGGCKQLHSLPQLPSSIKYLRAPGCISLETLQFTSMAGVSLNPNLIGVRLVNCMKLDGHSCTDAGLISRVSLKNYAFKSPEERERLREVYGIEDRFIYPGRKIPKWFKYRTSKGLITIDPHSNLLGFIFCIILHKIESFMVNWFLENNDGERRNLLDMGGYTWYETQDFEDLYSYHVCICFKECSGLIIERIEESRARNQNPRLSFEFITWEMDRVIKKCGVHPVYAEEEEHDDQDDGKKGDDKDEDEDEDDEYYKEVEELEMGNK